MCYPARAFSITLIISLFTIHLKEINYKLLGVKNYKMSLTERINKIGSTRKDFSIIVTFARAESSCIILLSVVVLIAAIQIQVYT